MPSNRYRRVRPLIVTTVLASAAAPIGVLGCSEEPPAANVASADAKPHVLPTTRIAVGDRALTVEVAANLAQLRAGMRKRPAPPEDGGVLFAFPDELDLRFDGRDVDAPLDVVYADETGTIDSVKRIGANDLREVASDAPTMYALMLRSGEAAKLGLKRGGTLPRPDLSHLPIAPDPLPTVAMTIGGHAFEIEVADDPTEMAMGMMYRDAFPEGTGMLFVFERERRLAFYMRNTRVPMDIVYLTEQGLIVSTHQMFPFDETPVPSAGPARYAVELPLGTAEKLKLRVADRMELPDLTKQVPPAAVR